jgi:hypothetical protein
LDWLLGERHIGVFSEEAGLFYVWMGRAALTAAIAWISYFAMEPYVRRFWPQTMITWSRVLEGKFRDPAVGRDVLVGGMCGILLVLIVQLDVLLLLVCEQPHDGERPRLVLAGQHLCRGAGHGAADLRLSHRPGRPAAVLGAAAHKASERELRPIIAESSLIYLPLSRSNRIIGRVYVLFFSKPHRFGKHFAHLAVMLPILAVSMRRVDPSACIVEITHFSSLRTISC